MVAVTPRCVLVAGGTHFRCTLPHLNACRSFRRNTSSSLLVCTSRGRDSQWTRLEGGSAAARAGHGAVLIQDNLYLVAGENGEKVVGDIVRLKLPEHDKEK